MDVVQEIGMDGLHLSAHELATLVYASQRTRVNRLKAIFYGAKKNDGGHYYAETLSQARRAFSRDTADPNIIRLAAHDLLMKATVADTKRNASRQEANAGAIELLADQFVNFPGARSMPTPILSTIIESVSVRVRPDLLLLFENKDCYIKLQITAPPKQRPSQARRSRDERLLDVRCHCLARAVGAKASDRAFRVLCWNLAESTIAVVTPSAEVAADVRDTCRDLSLIWQALGDRRAPPSQPAERGL